MNEISSIKPININNNRLKAIGSSEEVRHDVGSMASCYQLLEQAHTAYELAYVLAKSSNNPAQEFRNYCNKIELSALPVFMQELLHDSYMMRHEELSNVGISMNIKTYIAKNETTGLFKIGRTRQHVTERIKQFQGMAAGKCTPIAVIEGDKENALHKKFSDKNVYGEWFCLDESDIHFINGL